MKLKVGILLLCITLCLTGCGTTNFSSERIALQNRTSSVTDDTRLVAPQGYFVNTYEWVEVDEHTKQLVITLTDNKKFGEK